MEGSRFLKYSNERFSAHNERGMAPLPVDPAAAVKLWLKAADSEQTSEKWSRVQRAACKVPWLRSLTECQLLVAQRLPRDALRERMATCCRWWSFCSEVSIMLSCQ